MKIPQQRVLVADDDAAVRRLLGEIFSRAGFEVVLCEDGRVAFTRLGSDSYDLLVFDVHMPFITGMNLAQNVRLAGMSTPILLVSAGLDTHSRAPLHELDGLRVLSKPFHPDELLRAAESMLGTCESPTPPAGNPLLG